MIKTIRAYRNAPPEEDYSWALKMSESERLNVAYRLVRDLWAMAHGGEPYPEMDRSTARFVVPPQDYTEWRKKNMYVGESVHQVAECARASGARLREQYGVSV